MTTQAPVNQAETFADVFNAICDNIEITIRGQRDVIEDHLYLAQLQVTLQPGERFAVIASTEAAPNLDSAAAYRDRQAHEAALLERAGGLYATASGRTRDALRHLFAGECHRFSLPWHARCAARCVSRKCPG